MTRTWWLTVTLALAGPSLAAAQEPVTLKFPLPAKGDSQHCELSVRQHLRTMRGDRRYERMDITHLTGLTNAQRDAMRALGSLFELLRVESGHLAAYVQRG